MKKPVPRRPSSSSTTRRMARLSFQDIFFATVEHKLALSYIASNSQHQGNQTEGGVQWLDVSDVNAMIEQIGGVYVAKEGFADHPVVEVSWFGARAYCLWVGGWLPAEEKWECAASGPEHNTYPWGNSAPDCENANISECIDGTWPVGSHPDGSSWIAVQDMGGNVWEWVSDWYRLYPGSQHQGEDFGQMYKIVRGGS